MSNRLARFPAGFRQQIGDDALYEDIYGRDTLVLPGQEKTSVRLAEPHSNEFSFQFAGKTITPVRIDHRRKEVRDKFLGLFGGTTVYQHDSSLPSENGVFISGSAEDVSRLYPNATTREAIGSLQLATLLDEPPLYHSFLERNKIQTIDNREKLEVNSVLTSEQRSIIERSGGNIVFDSCPEGADRVLICLQHVHGHVDTPWVLRTVSHRAPLRFLQHQSQILETVRELRTPETRFFLETEEREPGSAGAIAYQLAMYRTFNHLQKTGMQRKLKGEFPWSASATTANANLGLRKMAYQYPEMSQQIYGDGREEERADLAQWEEEHRQKEILSRISKSGVGVASDLIEAKSKIDDHVFHRSQVNITQQVAKHLPQGGTGILVYGAGHFDSTKFSQTKQHTSKCFEEYLSLLPRTQVVVVQWEQGVQIMQDIETLKKKQKSLPPAVRNDVAAMLIQIETISLAILRCVVANRQETTIDHLDKKYDLRELTLMRETLVKIVHEIFVKQPIREE